ncbi:MAG: hypothetical protein IAF58_15785 [Leptolyngbya sp.]|nr:hypothetical protein [Candidatus Melainabacteria bacterium]
MQSSTGKIDNSAWILCGLCAIAASTMSVEIILTKFIGYKVFYHFINLIITMVILSFGAAGTYLYLKQADRKSIADGEQADGSGATSQVAQGFDVSDRIQWQSAAKEAALYSVLLTVAILLFCWLPLDPYDPDLHSILRLSSLALYFLIFAFPFFFAGLCINRVLANSSIPATRVYFFDLAAAAIAAALTPSAFELLGGYGAIAAASALGFIGFLAFQKASGNLSLPTIGGWSAAFVLVTVALFAYPSWAVKTYGFDIRSHKEPVLRNAFRDEFHGIQQTYWNPLARIDASGTTLTNNATLMYGYLLSKDRPKMEGRLVIVDGSAPTRQFAANGNINDHSFFKNILWATPYIMKPDAKDVLVIGGGGGIDIIIAKYFGIPKVSVLELNPATFKHLLLGEGDPEAARYQPWLKSTDKTKVTIYNKEARHFASMQKGHSYDIIQASGVDTLTAVASGALANSDNYLYTIDAVRSYFRMLNPDGFLSLTHWRFQPPQLGLKMFVTYLEFLDEIGIKEPWKHVVVIGNEWTDTVLKPTPFTEPELQKIRDWCKENGNAMVFDPGRRTTASPGVAPEEVIYQQLGFANPEERKKFLASYEFNVVPSTDDKPYFYQIARIQSLIGSYRWVSETTLAVYITLAIALFLALAPIVKLRSKVVSKTVLTELAFFATSGFAFLLFEVAIIQLCSIFVGGPTYSLAVVLVAVLGGYSLGSFISGLIPIKRSSFVIAGAGLCVMLIAAFAGLANLLTSLMSLPFEARIVVCAAITFAMSVVTGIPVSLGMEAVKRRDSSLVPWMWGVSSSFNALGSAVFTFLGQAIGINAILAVSATLYLLACTLFAFLGPVSSESETSSKS